MGRRATDALPGSPESQLAPIHPDSRSAKWHRYQGGAKQPQNDPRNTRHQPEQKTARHQDNSHHDDDDRHRRPTPVLAPVLVKLDKPLARPTGLQSLVTAFEIFPDGHNPDSSKPDDRRCFGSNNPNHESGKKVKLRRSGRTRTAAPGQGSRWNFVNGLPISQRAVSCDRVERCSTLCSPFQHAVFQPELGPSRQADLQEDLQENRRMIGHRRSPFGNCPTRAR